MFDLPAQDSSHPWCPDAGVTRPDLPRSRRARGPVDPAPLRAEADLVDRRIRALVAGQRHASVELAHALADMARRRLHEVYGFPDLVTYARDREVARSASEVKQMVMLIEHLEGLPLLREGPGRRLSSRSAEASPFLARREERSMAGGPVSSEQRSQGRRGPAKRLGN